jgi:glycosyltransferase involved in cell wall biosynthesis
MKTLCIEGWRFLSHSYSIVNQWQLLSLMKRKDLALYHRDLPFYMPQWTATRGLFSADDEGKIAALTPASEQTRFDALLRICAPFNLDTIDGQRTIVFGTTETRSLSPNLFSSTYDVTALSQREELTIITPSRWSQEGFLRHGFTSDQVKIIPHGVAVHVFFPDVEKRLETKHNLNLSGFVFANFSAMTYNKGLDILLRAFAIICETHPDCHLLLKGSDSLYPSRSMLEETLSALPATMRQFVAARISYIGSVLSMTDMANMYRAADCYVSPYRAEGFNLPPLEAAACGTPVICTAGGSTDDFMEEHFALKISASPRILLGEERVQEFLEPDLDHLVVLMRQAVEDNGWRQQAARAGAAHVATHLTWDRVTDRLCDVLFPT